ncbi:luciferase family protein [Streptomyces sp. NRRL F-5650]|uniref:luciferase domain-containing protein n=1 Tax=Streptomyces sp. NRRL F-5650 TaxID=1463868 RepID=UPI0004C53D3E|nr:luciferase family protein [Streptomyces sp. NRRL F-5650]
MTLAQRAFERLHAWPDLTAGPASCRTGRALRSVRDEIVHFHSDRDVDLHLTHRAIQRFQYDLGASTAIRLVPGSRWVTVHLDCDADVDLLLSLTSIALKAHQSRPPADPADGRPGSPGTAVPAGCNFHRVTVLPRSAAGEA